VLTGKKVLVTGATGQIARPIAERLAAENEVWCAARFTNPDARRELESVGIVTCPWTLGSGDFDGLPTDFTHVVHSAALMAAPEHDEAVRVNAEGTGLLMQHCRRAEAFVFISSFGLYQRQDPLHAYAETDPLGGYATYASSYPISKIATEGAVRAAARILELPTTIARMNIGYGKSGWGGLPVRFFDMIRKGEPVPVPAGYSNWGSPISEEDIAEQGAGAIFDIASVPATIVNWAGDEAVSERQYCDHLAAMAGLEVSYVESDITYDAFISDNTRRLELIGPCKVDWREGMPRAVASWFPEAMPT
jgi:nucleoside-diphosphate-sugar epimerase